MFRFVDRLNGVRAELNTLDGDIKAETGRFSEDIKYFAEFTTGITGLINSIAKTNGYF